MELVRNEHFHYLKNLRIKIILGLRRIFWFVYGYAPWLHRGGGLIEGIGTSVFGFYKGRGHALDSRSFREYLL